MVESSDIMQASITRLADSDEYEVALHGASERETIHLSDIVGLIPRQDGALAADSYTLVTISTADISSNSEFSGKSAARFCLKKYCISQLPPELSALVLDRISSPFFALDGDCESSSQLSIIVSIKSGTLQAEPFFNEVVQDLLTLLGVTKDKYAVHFTDSEKWVSDFASEVLSKKANEGIAQSVILLSGDGGIIDILNSLYAHPKSEKYVNPVIGLLILGTGNALANSSGLNAGNTKGLSILLNGLSRAIPTFACKCSPGSVLLIDEGRNAEALKPDEEGCGIVHGAVVVSWCLHATLVANSDTTEYRKFGSERFSMAANNLLSPADGSPPHRWVGKITTYHKLQSGKIEANVWQRREHMYILATLVSNLEAALKISPDSKPLDGQLRLVEFPPLPSDEVKNIFVMAFNRGKHIEHDSVGYETIEGLRIDFEESDETWRRICIDGKIVRVPQGGWIEVSMEKQSVADLMVPR